MKNILILTFAFFILSSFMPNHVNERSEEYRSCDTINTVFNSNEELTFEVFYNWNFIWVKAGRVNFSSTETTYAGKPSYLFKATGQTLSTYDPIYRVRDYYQSYVDKETMRPLKYVRDTDEGGHTRWQEIRFDYSNKTIDSKRGKSKEKAKDEEFPLEDCTYDVVSILYHLRNLDLEDRTYGEKIPINVFFDDKQYNLHVKYLGTETKKIKGQGTFKVHKVSPLLIKGSIFTETDQMIVYVSADDNKLPLMIESPIRVGSIKAVIKHAENLKYPIDAKID